MANILTPVDVYKLVNDIQKQATGQVSIQAVDTSSFVAVGEAILRTGTENTLNAISTVLMRTIISRRPYDNKLGILEGSSERWGAVIRKLNFFDLEFEESTAYNATNATTGASQAPLTDGQSVDMYTIKKPKTLQINFTGTKVLQNHYTVFRDQLAQAFRSESEFASFIEGFLVNWSNMMEQKKENEDRLVLINAITGKYAMSNYCVDLVAEFNTKYGTTYTRDQLLTTYLTDFAKFVSARVKTDSKRLENRTISYHANLSSYPGILRHTPKRNQKMIMYSPLFIDIEANVYSTIFNPSYLGVGAFKEITYWQEPTHPTEVKGKPNILNVVNGESTTASEAVVFDYVLGILYDDEFMGTNYQFETSVTTPLNAAGLYYNVFTHVRKNYWTDYTENAIVYYLGAGGSPATPDSSEVETTNSTKKSTKKVEVSE